MNDLVSPRTRKIFLKAFRIESVIASSPNSTAAEMTWSDIAATCFGLVFEARRLLYHSA